MIELETFDIHANNDDKHDAIEGPLLLHHKVLGIYSSWRLVYCTLSATSLTYSNGNVVFSVGFRDFTSIRSKGGLDFDLHTVDDVLRFRATSACESKKWTDAISERIAMLHHELNAAKECYVMKRNLKGFLGFHLWNKGFLHCNSEYLSYFRRSDKRELLRRISLEQVLMVVGPKVSGFQVRTCEHVHYSDTGDEDEAYSWVRWIRAKLREYKERLNDDDESNSESDDDSCIGDIIQKRENGKIYGKLMTLDLWKKLLHNIPSRYCTSSCNLLYSTELHGSSLNYFYSFSGIASPLVLIVKTIDGSIFGAFTTFELSKRQKYYGNNETLVFSNSKKFSCYKCTNRNKYYALVKYDHLSFGGGSNFAIFLNKSFTAGSSNRSETFNNPSLSETVDFEVALVELWTLIL